MQRVFPNSFILGELPGPRPAQFAVASDAFQQLVGDALKTLAYHLATVSPTKGRDGSIDIFVDSGSALSGPLSGLETPIIVECKDHDESSSRVTDNINAGWRQVREKLERAGDIGWTGHFEPWRRARSYVYCVSACIPNRKSREDLLASINSFFEKLKEKDAQIQEVRVLDWSDLRPWLNTIPTICDSWLGVRIPSILEHDDYSSQLTGFRRFLRSDQLRFVPPPSQDPTHPATLMRRLAQVDSKPGVLLSGPGGVGKTRTAFEVADLARSLGWRVLHVLPNAPPVSTEDIAETILPSQIKTMLVFDYLDQMPTLDLATLRRSVIPEAAKKGIELAVLANCRPGWITLDNPDRDELFETVSLRPSKDQSARIVNAIVDTVAASACNQFGKAEVLRICGHRPIIAMLIARELERRSKQGVLSLDQVRALRTGDLMYWLRRRMAEDSLSVQPDASRLLPSRPEPPVVGAAAALACAPESRDVLCRAAESALLSLSWANPEDSQHLVGVLENLGWLEPERNWLFAAHDVVADELLEQTLLSGSKVRTKELDAVLAGTLRSPTMIGRFATSLNRLLGSLEGHHASSPLLVETANWLRKQSQSLGQLLARTKPDASSYALGAVLIGPPWSEVAIELWDPLIAPWLQEHGRSPGARHILYMTLRVNTSARFIQLAAQWLQANADNQGASYIIYKLLRNTGNRVVPIGLAVDAAMRWLEDGKRSRSFSAGFVYPRLLDNVEVDSSHAVTIIRAAVRWLESYFDTTDAEFVLKKLLRRSDVPRDLMRSLIKSSIARLRLRLSEDEASFLLRWCLQSKVYDAALDAELFPLALQWLKLNMLHPRADFVFNRLLRRRDLSEEDRATVSGIAVTWLRTAPQSQPMLDYVYNSLLARISGLSDKDLDYLITELSKSFEEKRWSEQVSKRLCDNLKKARRWLPEDHPTVSTIDRLISECAPG